MKTILYIFILSILVFLASCSGSNSNKNTIVSIKTSEGDIKIQLYNETPLHRDNFIHLVNSGFYEGVSFHRVIKGFMIQAGDPLTKSGVTIRSDDTLNAYTIPAEFNRRLYHKKGALAAARMANDVNPQMRSSGTQFYIVQGRQLSDNDLVKFEQTIQNNIKQANFIRLLSEITNSSAKAGMKLSPAEIQERASLQLYDLMDAWSDYKLSDEQRKTYKTIGGIPPLDGTYTVFGEVIDGIETVDKIADSPTDSIDKPFKDIRILKMRIVSK